MIEGSGCFSEISSVDGPVKKTLVVRVAERLRFDMTKDGAEDPVPSCRELSATMGVSLPTAMEALRLLAADGFLTKEDGTSRYQRAIAPSDEPAHSKRRLLVIRSSSGVALDAHSRMRIDRLVMESTASGWTVHEKILSYGPDRRRTDRRWDELVRRFQPTRIVVSSGSPLLAKWLVRTGIDTLFLGGSSGTTGIPTLGVSLSASLRALLPRLLGSGERLISMPVCDYGPEYIEAFRNSFSDAMADAGLPFVPTYHIPATSERGPEALRAMLDKVMKAKPPTTLVFINYLHYMAALGLIRQYGLVPGMTVKVVILWFEEELLWMDPCPAVFRYPREQIWKLMMKWMRKPDDERFKQGAIHIPAEFVPGCGIT